MADLTGMMQAAAGSAGGAGEFIAVAHSEPPYFSLLDHTTPGTVSLATTYALINVGRGAAFSPSGDYIAVASSAVSGLTSPFSTTQLQERLV